MFKYLVATMFLIACGSQFKPCTSDTNCPSDQNESPGPTGSPGKDGTNGKDAAQPFFIMTSADQTMCENGGTIILNGYDLNSDGIYSYDEVKSSFVVCNGLNGKDGTNGSNGIDGSSCTVSPGINGAIITCSDGTSALVLNGSNGINGIDGAKGDTGAQGPAGSPTAPTAYSITSIVDPCGTAPGIYNEVFFKLADGQLVASFSDDSNGKNTRFSILTPGSYMTTDGDHCYFSVDSNNNIYNEHH